MSQDKLYRTYKGKDGGDFEGRTFVNIAGYQVSARAALTEAGAEIKGRGAYLLPEGQEDALITKLDELTVADRAQALKDRTPVAAADAQKLKIGDTFDFGGEVGNAKITGIGNTFTPKGKSAHDDRLDALDGKETVFLYNANEPKSSKPRPELTDEEKAARAEAQAERLKERDRTRIPVIAGTVEAGGNVRVGGEDVAVTSLGATWDLDSDEGVAALKARFPDVEGIEKGATVQFARFEEPEASPAP